MIETPKIIIVDNNDKIIGSKARGTLDKDDIYRVSALWITNFKNNILLAKRHHTKTHNPNKWGPAVAGTVEEHETYENNIVKEAEEELNLKDTKFELGPKTRTDDIYHHFTQWYILKTNKDLADFKIQTNEVEEIRWFSAQELEKQIQEHPEEFLPRMENYLKLFSSN